MMKIDNLDKNTIAKQNSIMPIRLIFELAYVLQESLT